MLHLRIDSILNYLLLLFEFSRIFMCGLSLQQVVVVLSNGLGWVRFVSFRNHNVMFSSILNYLPLLSKISEALCVGCVCRLVLFLLLYEFVLFRIILSL